MENNSVPYIAYEAALARFERTIKRLWITIIILILLLASTNAAWIYYESQFMDETATIEAEANEGGNAVINGSGAVNINGESKGH